MIKQFWKDFRKAAKYTVHTVRSIVFETTLDLKNESNKDNEAIFTVTNTKSKRKKVGTDNIANNACSTFKKQIRICKICRKNRYDLTKC